MIKSEVSEIKKLFEYRNCGIDRICGCYVDAEKTIKARWAHAFLTLPEEEIMKYLELLKKNFSGGLGKSLVNLEFTKSAGQQGRIRELLEELRCSRLGNRDALEELYEYIIEEYDYIGQYAILLVHDTYDIPGKSTDGTEMEDASDEIYNYILLCICPVTSQKAGLIYDTEKSIFTNLNTGKMLSAPDVGLLYPSFNDRSADPNGCLGYSRTMETEARSILEAFTGSEITLSAGEQKKAYNTIIEQALGAEATMDEVRRVEEHLQKLKTDHAGEPEQYMLEKADLVKIFRDSSIDEHRVGALENAYDTELGYDTKLTLDNLGSLRAFTVSTDVGKVQIKPEYAFKLSIQELDGQRVLVLPLEGDVEVNGILVDVG